MNNDQQKCRLVPETALAFESRVSSEISNLAMSRTHQKYQGLTTCRSRAIRSIRQGAIMIAGGSAVVVALQAICAHNLLADGLRVFRTCFEIPFPFFCFCFFKSKRPPPHTRTVCKKLCFIVRGPWAQVVHEESSFCSKTKVLFPCTSKRVFQDAFVGEGS